MPKFRRAAWLATLLATPAAAQSFEDLDQLEAQVVASLGAAIGEPGGPSQPIDRRLRLTPCPEPATVEEPAMGAVTIRCRSVGWRIRVPLASGGAGSSGAVAARRAEPVIRRGDQVEVVAGTSRFRVSTHGIAEQNGAPGDTIRVRRPDSATRLIGEVLPDGRVALPGFN